MKRLVYLDGWRGLAILCVLVGHFTPIPGINLGTLGVELFFALSGRLMAEILFVQHFPLEQFYKRRLSRVYPALFAFVLSAFIAFRDTSLSFGPKALITALTFIFNYNTVIPGLYRTGALDHIWSLCVEEHSYVILGLIAFYSRHPLPIIVGMTAFSMIDGLISSFVYSQDYFHVYWRTDTHLASIFIAVAFYLNKARGGSPIFTLLAGFLFSIDYFPSPVHYTIATAFFAHAICNLEASPMAMRILSIPALTYVGLISYSLYLWQQPFYKLAVTCQSLWPLLPAIGCSLASFYLIERPARNWLNRNW